MSKIKLFLQKNAKFLSAGVSPPDPQTTPYCGFLVTRLSLYVSVIILMMVPQTDFSCYIAYLIYGPHSTKIVTAIWRTFYGREITFCKNYSFKTTWLGDYLLPVITLYLTCCIWRHWNHMKRLNKFQSNYSNWWWLRSNINTNIFYNFFKTFFIMFCFLFGRKVFYYAYHSQVLWASSIPSCIKNYTLLLKFL